MAKRNRTLAGASLTLQEIEPLTRNQVKAFDSNKHLILHGLAGTGKTFISCYLAFDDMSKGAYDKLVIIRSAVPTRDIGFLPGTEKEKSLTRIGSNNMLMAYVHIAHDCQIGNHVIMSNNASLAGHVRIHDWAILGGFTLVKQFCMIGMHTYIGMGCQVNKDIPAYMVASGTQTRVRSINAEGMRRRGFSSSAIASIKRAFKVVYRESTGRLLDQMLNELEASEADSPEVMQFVNCIRGSKVGILRGPVEE